MWRSMTFNPEELKSLTNQRIFLETRWLGWNEKTLNALSFKNLLYFYQLRIVLILAKT